MIMQEEMGTTARRYSRRDRRLGAIPLPESMFLFITFQEPGGMAEITFGFPSVFRRRVPFPCGQVQSAGSGAFVRRIASTLYSSSLSMTSGGGDENDGPYDSVER